MTRAVIYARYSSDNQRDASIEDQVRQCRARIEQERWQLVRSILTMRSAAPPPCGPATKRCSRMPGQAALRSLSPKPSIASRAIRRISPACSSSFRFAGVRLVTLSEGEIGELHVGLKGTMNALFLKDLAHKTRRGLEGRVRQGKSGGGLCFGYDVVRRVDAAGEPVHGERRINEGEAAIVRRIFEEFAKGRSPRAIASRLNKESIPGPAGKSWGPSTIYGNWRRGTGILNNELYIGRLVWNRQQFIKDPKHRKAPGATKPGEQMDRRRACRIFAFVDDELWNSVKERQREARSRIMTKDKGIRSERARRPRYLLSGLLKCGTCGGGFSMISQTHYGCSTARNKGTCGNLTHGAAGRLEATVLDGLKTPVDASRTGQGRSSRSFTER